MSDRKPTKAKLRNETGCISYATFLHPNPKFYKYFWRVFCNDSEHEGADFFKFEPELSTAAYIAKRHELAARGEACIVYNRRVPRRFEGMPFDPNSERWQEYEWAPAWEDDTDAVYDGFK